LIGAAIGALAGLALGVVTNSRARAALPQHG
jgi:hypothetical protein